MPVISEQSESDAQTSYSVTDVIWSGATTACESVVIADSAAYGRLLFLDGELQSASADEHVYHETLIHPAMASLSPLKEGHGSVLVVGGGEGATVREVLKWSAVSRIDWVDIDGELVELCDRHLRWSSGVRQNPRVRYQAADIRDALPGLGLYDLIVLDLPDPDGETGWLYSADMWSALADHLKEGGRIVTHTGPVRPLGRIGEGLQRVWAAAQASDRFTCSVRAFWHTVIPSFQGSWGFWMTGPDPGPAWQKAWLPLSRVVDSEQLEHWTHPPALWRFALLDLDGPIEDSPNYRVRFHGS